LANNYDLRTKISQQHASTHDAAKHLTTKSIIILKYVLHMAVKVDIVHVGDNIGQRSSRHHWRQDQYASGVD